MKKPNELAQSLGLQNMTSEETIVMMKSCYSVTKDQEKTLEDMQLIDKLLDVSRTSKIVNGQRKPGRRKLDRVARIDMISQMLETDEMNPTPVSGTPGKYAFIIHGAVNPVFTEYDESKLVEAGKVYGFSPSDIKKIISKPRPWIMNRGQWSLHKF